ncbi:hypothetical protein WH47_10511 [Habropoda laboriosa]|uniref:Uncharacterized protein n=1 Tax=Habropoda laboriosa TaxID=597456 RepID=A0A0L7R9K9_9HYME|nr:hypothetical protein WH47_10511 [Habropoda laboriosa]
MTGSKEVTGMKCVDWFSPERLPRNWHRQRMMDYQAPDASPPRSHLPFPFDLHHSDSVLFLLFLA